MEKSIKKKTCFFFNEEYWLVGWFVHKYKVTTQLLCEVNLAFMAESAREREGEGERGRVGEDGWVGRWMGVEGRVLKGPPASKP